MSDFRPTIVIDTREQTPLVFKNLPAIQGTLQSGDYSIAGLEDHFAVERKTVADLVGCCVGDSRSRFEREMHRLRGFRFKRILIIGSRLEVEQHRYRSGIPPASVIGSLAAWEVRYDIPVTWSLTPEDGAVMIERWAHYFCRETLKAADQITKASVT